MTAESTVPAGAFERLQAFAARIGCGLSRYETPESGELWRITGQLEVVYNPHTFLALVTGTRHWRDTTSSKEAALCAVRPPPMIPREERIEVTAEHRKRFHKNRRRGSRKRTCHWCGLKLNRSTVTMDHVVPVACGGTSDLFNLVQACESCNMTRKHYLPELNGWTGGGDDAA